MVFNGSFGFVVSEGDFTVVSRVVLGVILGVDFSCGFGVVLKLCLLTITGFDFGGDSGDDFGEVLETGFKVTFEVLSKTLS